MGLGGLGGFGRDFGGIVRILGGFWGGLDLGVDLGGIVRILRGFWGVGGPRKS